MSLSFQDPATQSIRELIFLYDHVLILMVSILIFISYIFYYLLVNPIFYKFFSENTFLESVWSVVPSIIIIFLVIPSIRLLYIVEDVKTPSYTFKVVGHQWYWTYVSPLFKNFSYSIGNDIFSGFEYDSFLDVESRDSPRLLGCSCDFFIPVHTTSRLLVSSTDVIHSFSIPSIRLKVDAIPGRINQLFVTPRVVGSFFGQCSEICGSNHSFMPISLKVCGLGDFDSISKSQVLELLGGGDF